MRVRVKICGITSVDDVREAISAGADALGFVFAESPRRVDVDIAKRLISYVPPFVTTVAVFRLPSSEEVKQIVSQCGPDVVQAEPSSVVKSAVTANTRLLPVVHEGEDDWNDVLKYANTHRDNPGLLLEASGRGGRGVAPDWDLAAELARVTPLVLAGGLNPTNVQDAIRHVRPCAVDVSSGVERSPGSKDPDLIREFVAEVRKAETLLKDEAEQ